MDVRRGNRDLFKFFQNNKDEFIAICQQEVDDLKSAKIQFALNVKFHSDRNGHVEHMDYYFTECNQ